MTMRRRAGGVLVMALLVLAGCADEESPPGESSPTAPTPTLSSEAPSPEELAAQDAMTVFQEMLRVTDAASQAPGSRDWEPEIRRHAGDPAALLAVQSVRDL